MPQDSKDTIGISVKKSEDVAEWYEQVCLKSEIADFGEIKGTITIRPRGFYIWEQIQQWFNGKIDKMDVEQAYFPFLIPWRFFTKEAKHAEGFAPELAWVTSERADPSEEKAVIRPTSETIIVESFRKWLRNYKQLPIKINQWCNIFRWEVKQTKLFLRGREFLWQEGHCIYETKEECEKDVFTIIKLYEQLCKDVLAVPVLVGEKTPAETFAGADNTLAIESIMPDGKALQMGTSHYLGQGFMKGFDVKFKGSDEKDHFPHYNSWGVSTRLIGATIMTHSDDKGLVLPPRLVKQKVIIIPVIKKTKPEHFDAYVEKVKSDLASFGATIDTRSEYSMGWKLNEWELKGVPLIIIIGDREMEQGVVTLKYRDLADKQQLPAKDIADSVAQGFENMHSRLYEKALANQNSFMVEAKTVSEFETAAKAGKIIKTFASEDPSDEAMIAEKYGVGSRCIQFNSPTGTCIFTGKPAKIIYFGRSY